MQFEAGYAGWIQKRLGQEDMAAYSPKQEDVASACLEQYKAAVTVWVHEYQMAPKAWKTSLPNELPLRQQDKDLVIVPF